MNSISTASRFAPGSSQLARYVPLVLLSALIAARTPAMQTLYDTLWITDTTAYDSGLGNTYSGRGVFGGIYNYRLFDDFSIDANEYPDGFLIQQLTQDSVSFFGRAPSDGVCVRIYDTPVPDPHQKPLIEELWNASHVQTTGFDDSLFGLQGVRISVSFPGYLLSPGHYWVGIQPVDTTPEGDWYYQLRDTDTLIGEDTYMAILDQEWSYGFTHDYGYGYGTAAMKIEGVPEPAGAALLIVGALLLRGSR